MSFNLKNKSIVSIIMGSKSDWASLKKSAEILKKLKIKYNVKIVSAHRTPMRLVEFAKSAKKNKISVIIAGAGGSAHLPGMVAAITDLPVIGVPMETKSLKGLDSLLSIVQMPFGIPVGTVAIGETGAKKYATILIISQEPIELEHSISNIKASCRKDVPQEKVPGTTYTVNP